MSDEDRSKEELADHIIRRQIRPQQFGRRHNIATPFVDTSNTAEGVQVSCVKCGRSATLIGYTEEQVAGKVVMCPDCMGLPS